MLETILNILKWLFGVHKGVVEAPEPSQASGSLESLLIALEGSSNAPYADPIGLGTIGVGHLIIKNDTNLIKVTGTDDQDFLRKNPLANSQVKDLLSLDLKKFQEFIRGFGFKLTGDEENALVSFIFNVGTGAFNKSTMKRLLVNKAPRSEIALEFLKWRKAGGRIMSGLQVRRAVEATIFLSLPKVPEMFLHQVPTKNHRRVDQLLGVYYDG